MAGIAFNVTFNGTTMSANDKVSIQSSSNNFVCGSTGSTVSGSYLLTPTVISGAPVSFSFLLNQKYQLKELKSLIVFDVMLMNI